MRRVVSVLFACVGVFFAGFAGLAQAQSYPNKTISFVVPFAAGSATDGLARAIAQEVGRETGQSVIVENKPGANGFIAAQAVAQAAPDGHTVFITTNTTQAANQHLFKKLPYDPVKGYSPVTALAKGYQIMVVNPKVSVNSVADVIAHAKRNPRVALPRESRSSCSSR
jgi:tripartite-type tricarboxylate transporter receptor subunit TctC